MVRYETLLLVRPDMTGDELVDLESRIEKLIVGAQGALKAFDKWGKYHLAYPVRKNEYGVYLLIRFTIEPKQAPTLLGEMNTTFKIKYNDLVMRFVTKKLASNAPEEYAKPDPVDASSMSGLDSSIKKIASDLDMDDDAPSSLDDEEGELSASKNDAIDEIPLEISSEQQAQS